MNAQALINAKNVFAIEADALLYTMSKMDWSAFAKAVDILKTAPRIGASGCGHSGIACQHFAHLMCCIQRPSRFISPAEAVHGGMGFIQKNDAMVLASRGGKTSELLPIMDICQKKEAVIISITENPNSPLATGAHIWLPMAVTKECDPFNAQGTTSNTVLNAIFDALQTALIEENPYQIDQFALIHPGGAVGKRLNK